MGVAITSAHFGVTGFKHLNYVHIFVLLVLHKLSEIGRLLTLRPSLVPEVRSTCTFSVISHILISPQEN